MCRRRACADERIQLEAANAILDRDLGRPATIQADVTVIGSLSADHLQEVARTRQAEPIDLGEREVSYVTPRRLGDQ